jgi:hypothetical protein
VLQPAASIVGLQRLLVVGVLRLAYAAKVIGRVDIWRRRRPPRTCDWYGTSCLRRSDVFLYPGRRRPSGVSRERGSLRPSSTGFCCKWPRLPHRPPSWAFSTERATEVYSRRLFSMGDMTGMFRLVEPAYGSIPLMSPSIPCVVSQYAQRVQDVLGLGRVPRIVE